MSQRRCLRVLSHASLAAAALAVAAVAGCVNDVDDRGRGDGGALFVAQDRDLFGRLEDAGGGWMETHVIPAASPFSRIGIRFDADGPVAVEARVSDDGGQTFTAWTRATPTFREARANNAFVDVVDGAHTHLQLRMMAPVESGLTFLAVEAFERMSDEASPSSSHAQGLAADGIAVTRAAWGARTRDCYSPQAPSMITIHHTETPSNDAMSTAARLRQIQNYHIDVRGFCDIGYHFLVGQDGQVYQGRPENVVGAHAGGHNQDNVGIAFVGTFNDAAPSDAMMSAAARIMGALARGYGISLSRTTVKGHRELGNTDCPGDALDARLDELVAAAADAAAGDAGAGGGAGAGAGGGLGAVYAGLTQGTAEIPRAGLHNHTLQGALGLSTEPYGDVVTDGGRQFVEGRVSWFGGPADTGVSSTETGSVSGDRLRSLSSPLDASPSTIASRPEDFYYLAMRWDYTPGIAFWRGARILVVNPDNGRAVVLRPVDWGPNTSTHRLLDISPQAMADLGTDTDGRLRVAFAQPGAPLGVVAADAPPATGGGVIPAGATWQWQLTGALDQSFDVDVYDIDLFDNGASTVASLKAQGRTVVCYFSAGTWESWRPDAGDLPAAARGNPLEAPFSDERWLDTRSDPVRDVVRARLDLAADKGCDAVEPDNVDAYQNDPGFPLTSQTQLDFNRFVAAEAHARGLSVGLKNDVAQVPSLVDAFDWALNEQCVEYSECNGYAATFIAAGKAVLNAEYNGDIAAVCAVTRPLGLSSIKKNVALDAARESCP